MTKFSTACLAVILPLSVLWACGSSSDGDAQSAGGSSSAGSSASGGADASGGSSGSLGLGGDALGASGDGNAPSGGTTNTTGGTLGSGGTLGTELCGDVGCACSNGIDDDGDGLVDGFDPECTGPFDNDEGSFATGIPGDNRDPKWQDCFFDGNSGAGDDKCRYHTDCLTGDKEPTHRDCTLTEACIEFCAPRTPNGCDCFGCCTVRLPSGDTVDILTGSDCSLEQAEDTSACSPCVKSDACGNACGRCELCPGKTIADLPADCAPDEGAGGAGSGDDPGYTCDDGEQVCGPNLPGCPFGQYCALGCCLVTQPK